MNKISGILMLFIYVCISSTMLKESFVSELNLGNLLRWSSMHGVIAIAAAFVIITGGIDLSIGSTIALLGCLLPMLLVEYEWSIAVSLAAVMGLACLIGLTHGLLVTKMRLQPFIVTLCGLLIYRGLSRWITGDRSRGFDTDFDNSLRLLATGSPCSAAFVVMIGGAVIALWFLVKTLFGLRETARRQVYVNLFGLLGGVVLAAIGSSRYWQGVETQIRSDIVLFEGVKFATWKTIVPKSAAEMPGELMWWCGLSCIPFFGWFVWTACKGSRRFLRVLTAQLVVAAVCFPIALMFSQDANSEAFDFIPLSPAWLGRLRMAAVFVSLGGIMATLAWFFQSGIKAGGEPARLPAIATGVTALMWLMGKSEWVRQKMVEWAWPDSLLALSGSTDLLEVRVPAPFFVLLTLAILAAAFLNLSIYGRYLLALGRNEQAARYSGIRTDRMVIMAYVLCSAITGIGAILFTLDGNAVQPSGHGANYELYAIAAAVLGGCSLRGGEGSILGVVIGAAVMRAITNSIGLLGIASQLELAIIGIVILVGVLADEIVRRIAARRRAAEQAAAAASRRAG